MGRDERNLQRFNFLLIIYNFHFHFLPITSNCLKKIKSPNFPKSSSFWNCLKEKNLFRLFLPFRFSSFQLLSHVWLFVTPWTAAHQASLSITNSRSLLKRKSTELVMPSNHITLCCTCVIPPSIFPSIRVFSNESVFRIRWPKYWSFSFSISPSNEYSDWSPLGLTGLISLQSKGLSRVFSNITVQKHQLFSTQPSLWSNSHIHTWLLEKP